MYVQYIYNYVYMYIVYVDWNLCFLEPRRNLREYKQFVANEISFVACARSVDNYDKVPQYLASYMYMY